MKAPPANACSAANDGQGIRKWECEISVMPVVAFSAVDQPKKGGLL